MDTTNNNSTEKEDDHNNNRDNSNDTITKKDDQTKEKVNDNQPTKEEASSLLSFRNLRSLFEEEGLTDMSAAHVDYVFLQHYRNNHNNSTIKTTTTTTTTTQSLSSLLCRSTIRIEQDPHLAARISSSTSDQNNDGAKSSSSSSLPLEQNINKHDNNNKDDFFFGHGSTEKSSATGATVWDSSVVVCRFLEQAFFPLDNISANDNDNNNEDKGEGRSRKDPKCHKHFLELGSGTGLVACALRRLLLLFNPNETEEKKVKTFCTDSVATVMCTDRGEMMPLLQRNLSLDVNATTIAASVVDNNEDDNDKDDEKVMDSSSNDTNSATKEVQQQKSKNDEIDNNVFQTGKVCVMANSYHWGEPIETVLCSHLYNTCKGNNSDNKNKRDDNGTIVTPHPTFILAIDCIYDVDVVPRLVSSLRMLLCYQGGPSSSSSSSTTTPKKVALISTDESYRRPHAFELFTKLVIEEEGMILEEISTCHCLEEDFQRESVHLFWLYYK